MHAHFGLYFARNWVLPSFLFLLVSALPGLGTGFGAIHLKGAGKAQLFTPEAAQFSAAGTYRGHPPAADAAQRTFTLRLETDGSFVLTTVYIGKGKVLERGSWRQDADEIVLTFQPVGSSPPPNPITFRYRHDALHPTDWDPSEWGRKGPPVFSRTKAEEPTKDS